MPPPVVATPTEPCGGIYFDGVPMPLVLAAGTASGYKRVKKIDDETFAAYRTVGGKQQHVWTSDSACLLNILAAIDARSPPGC